MNQRIRELFEQAWAAAEQQCDVQGVFYVVEFDT